ncbi:hypothetical protein ACJX0J_031482, partial [Zea mays]
FMKELADILRKRKEEKNQGSATSFPLCLSTRTLISLGNQFIFSVFPTCVATFHLGIAVVVYALCSTYSNFYILHDASNSREKRERIHYIGSILLGATRLLLYLRNWNYMIVVSYIVLRVYVSLLHEVVENKILTLGGKPSYNLIIWEVSCLGSIIRATPRD